MCSGIVLGLRMAFRVACLCQARLSCPKQKLYRKVTASRPANLWRQVLGSLQTHETRLLW